MPTFDERPYADLSERAFRALLRTYPKGFRNEYGPLMMQAFGDLCHEERRRGGALGIARLWVRTVPDLAVSMVSERSKAMGNVLARVGGFVTLRNLMFLNGALLLAFGIVFANAAPVHVYGLAELPVDWQDPKEYATIAMGRLLGVVCLGFGAMLLATSNIAAKYAPLAVSGALFVTYAFGALSLSGVQIAMWGSTVGGITVAVHLFFAASYGLYWFWGTLAYSPANQPTPVQGGESY